MIYWIEAKDIITKSVAGIVKSDGSVDERLVRNCSNSYARPYFFTSIFAPLQHYIRDLHQGFKDSGLIDPDNTPSPTLMLHAASRQAAMSLTSIIKISFAIAALRNTEHQDGVLGKVVQRLKKDFPDPDILRANSIFPSMRVVNWEVVDRVHLEVAATSDLTTFSTMVFKDAPINPVNAGSLLSHLRVGYSAPPHQGLFKITDQTAESLRQGLLALTSNDLDLRHLDYLAHIDSDAGPRNGQISRALPVEYGNIVPCFT